ncbi:MAG TPA: hypothetical protein VGR19_10990 [Allosphingosinicella sp.]|nr:hypothetical protein [Allosphingosinicella sp.]
MGAGDRPNNPGSNKDDSKEEAGFRPLTAAAVLGGAVAATAGAYLGTRALARKNREKDGRPINSVMAAAITATALAPDKEAAVPAETGAPGEPKA